MVVLACFVASLTVDPNRGVDALRDIVEPFEDLKKCEECILGQPVCSEAGACPLHDFWKDVRERYIEELKTKTLEDLKTFQLKQLNAMGAGLFKKVGAVPGKQSLRQKSKRSTATSQ